MEQTIAPPCHPRYLRLGLLRIKKFLRENSVKFRVKIRPDGYATAII